MDQYINDVQRNKSKTEEPVFNVINNEYILVFKPLEEPNHTYLYQPHHNRGGRRHGCFLNSH